MKRLENIFCIAALLLVFLPGNLPAQQGGNIKFGNLAIIPAIEGQAIYDDNIYRGTGRTYPTAPQTDQEKKESDFIYHVKPGLLLNYTMPERGYINLGYQGDFAFYNKNNSNNWKNNQGLLDVNYTAPGGLILGINDLYSRSEDPYGSADQYNVGRVTKRWTNDLKTKLGYAFTTNFRTLLYFNHYKQKYDNSLLDYSQDYTDSEYGAGAEARVLPKTWAFTRYHYGVRKNNTNAPGQTDAFNSDAIWHRVNLGLAWDPGAKLSGELNFGYQWRKYDHQYTSAAQTTSREDKNTWVAATVLNFQATETTSLGLNITRAVRSTASDTNEQFTDTGIGITLSQKFLTKFVLMAGLSYSKNEYNLPVGTERVDDNYLANIGVNYNIREWMTLGIGYNYNRKNSNVEVQEFVDNQFLVSLKVVY